VSRRTIAHARRAGRPPLVSRRVHATTHLACAGLTVCAGLGFVAVWVQPHLKHIVGLRRRKSGACKSMRFEGGEPALPRQRRAVRLNAGRQDACDETGLFDWRRRRKTRGPGHQQQVPRSHRCRRPQVGRTRSGVYGGTSLRSTFGGDGGMQMVHVSSMGMFVCVKCV
jgi:hypothetical protein